MNRSSQQTTSRSTMPNPTHSTSDNTSQSGTVLTRVIPLSSKCPGVQVGRDSGLGSTDTAGLSSMERQESDHLLVSNSDDLGRSTSLSSEEHYPTVVQGPVLIGTGTQIVTDRVSGHQPATRSSFTSSLLVAEPQRVMLEQQSLPVQQSFMAEQQSMAPEQHFSMSGQVMSNISAGASSSFPLKYSIQVASASDTYGSVPAYLDISSVPLTSTALVSAPSAPDSASCEEEFEQIVVHSYEHKEEFKEGQFDIVLVYSESDRDEALAFRDILTKFVILQDGRPPSICVLDQNEHLSYINSRFSHMEEALRRSTYMFLFLTKDFCGDNWAQLQRDECLMESIQNPEKKWCVVPILTKSRKEADYQLPFGLRALKGVEISHMLRGKTLNSVAVNALGPKDVDPFFLKNMTKMLNDRIYLKIEREKRQLLSFQNWLKEEKHRKWKEQQKEKFNNELRDRKLVTERQYLQKELEARKMQEIMAAKAEAAKRAETEAAEYICQLKTTEKATNSTKFQPLTLEAEPIGQNVATKAETTVVHNNYYGPVHQIYGPVSNLQIGNENDQHIEKEVSDHVYLDATDLETDAPGSIDYIVVTEEASALLQQDAGLESIQVSRSGSVADECKDILEEMTEPRPTAVLCSAAGEKEEMSAEDERSPEIDRPQSLPVHNVLSHCSAADSSHMVTQNPMSSGTNVADAGNSLQGFATLQSFLSYPSVRPMAAVIPICQKSLPELSDDEQGEEMKLKLLCCDKDETEISLKSSYLGKNESPVNVETNVMHISMEINDRKTLTTANAENQIAVAGLEANFKPGLNSPQTCAGSMMLKIKDEAHLKPEDVVCEVPCKNDTSGTEKCKPEGGAVELAASFAGSSSVDPIFSQSQNSIKKQTDVEKGCSNESTVYHRSPGSISSLKATANHAAEKSTCTVS